MPGDSRVIVSLPVLALGLMLCSASASAEDRQIRYISDAEFDRIVSVTQGWGELGINTAVVPPGRPPMKLRIKDREYEHGFGHHAPGDIVVDLGGQYKAFETEIGIQWQGGQNLASVVFQVYVDGELRFDSGVVRESDAPRKISIPVQGADELRLVATDAGDGITCDCANWANPALIGPVAPARPSTPKPSVDVAAFARVATWDVKRMQGTKASRVEEFPAEDIALETPLAPAPDGTYRVPASATSAGCIGLQWYEQRVLRRLALDFADPAAAPAPDRVHMEYWVGESAWQGTWTPLKTPAEKTPGGLAWRLGLRDVPRGTQKVRWIVPASAGPVLVRRPSAYSSSVWREIELQIEPTKPLPGTRAEIEVYNGVFAEPPQGGSPLACAWDMAGPLRAKVRYSVAKPYKADRTVLRFRLPQTAVAVAVEDLLTNPCVFVPHAGVFVTRLPAPVTLADYSRGIQGKRTILQRVAQRPDHSFAQAVAKVHNPVQDLGPMMLSLACDNRKFVAEREGRVIFDLYDRPDDPPRDMPSQCQLVPRFGDGKNGKKLALSRHLDGGWLPLPVTTWNDQGLFYRQKTFVAPEGEPLPGGFAGLRRRAVGVVEYSVENRRPAGAAARLGLSLQSGNRALALRKTGEGLAATENDRLIALIDASRGGPLSATIDASGVTFAGQLPAGAVACIQVYLPAWKCSPSEAGKLISAADRASQTAAYWKELTRGAMDVELPDPLLGNVIRASQVHCLLAARNEEGGRRVSVWISSDRYGPLESEANSILRGMSFWGHSDFVRRGHDYFLSRYNKAGMLTTGYTLLGTGENLWTLPEHFEQAPDRAWAQRAAPVLARACKWIVRQRAKTKRLDPTGEKTPEYGLMPPGVTADWNRYAYRFFNEAYYCAGLEAAARMLAALDHPEAAALLAEARQYREDVVRACRWAQARSPVVPLQSGVWVPNHPSLLDCFGNVEEFLPGEDGNRSWAYSVEIGSHHLPANGLLPPAGEEVLWMADYLEDHQFLRSGMGDYPEQASRADPLSLGGFAKVQPYYGRIAEVYALRDDVKPFLRSYFNAIPSLLSLENLSFWEHFHNVGGWNKTHETGWFLVQSRLLLVMERGDDLWLAPMVTSQWLKDGMTIRVRGAPTRFGEVSYLIRSHAGQGFIEAEIEPPARTPPKQLVLRVRHPDARPMRAVTVGGQRHEAFDPAKEIVRLVPSGRPIRVRIEY